MHMNMNINMNMNMNVSTHMHMYTHLTATITTQVHRVQGTTIGSDLHALINKEFFSPGQAYVAISRVRRLAQLHFWALDDDAFEVDPRIARQYKLLRRRPLTREFVDGVSRPQQRPRLLPLAAVARVAKRPRRDEAGDDARSATRRPRRASAGDEAGSSAAHARLPAGEV